jgi:hypothetical protein
MCRIATAEIIHTFAFEVPVREPVRKTLPLSTIAPQDELFNRHADRSAEPPFKIIANPPTAPQTQDRASL